MSTQILVKAWPRLAAKSFQALPLNALNDCGWSKDGNDQSRSLGGLSLSASLNEYMGEMEERE